MKHGPITGGTNRYRLCPGHDARPYKKHRDALRHLLKDLSGCGSDVRIGEFDLTRCDVRRDRFHALGNVW